MLQGVKSSHVITVLRRSSTIGKMCTNNCYTYRCEKTLKGVSVTYSRLRGATDDDRSREDAAPWRHHEAPQHGKRLGYSRLRLERGIRFRYLVLGWVHLGTWDLYDIPGLSRMRGFADKETPGTPFEQWHAVTKTSKMDSLLLGHTAISTQAFIGFHQFYGGQWWTFSANHWDARTKLPHGENCRSLGTQETSKMRRRAGMVGFPMNGNA